MIINNCERYGCRKEKQIGNTSFNYSFIRLINRDFSCVLAGCQEYKGSHILYLLVSVGD